MDIVLLLSFSLLVCIHLLIVFHLGILLVALFAEVDDVDIIWGLFRALYNVCVH